MKKKNSFMTSFDCRRFLIMASYLREKYFSAIECTTDTIRGDVKFMLEAFFLPDDYSTNESDNSLVWDTAIRYQRGMLVESGHYKPVSESGRGFWRNTDRGNEEAFELLNQLEIFRSFGDSIEEEDLFLLYEDITKLFASGQLFSEVIGNETVLEVEEKQRRLRKHESRTDTERKWLEGQLEEILHKIRRRDLGWTLAVKDKNRHSHNGNLTCESTGFSFSDIDGLSDKEIKKLNRFLHAHHINEIGERPGEGSESSVEDGIVLLSWYHELFHLFDDEEKTKRVLLSICKKLITLLGTGGEQDE